MAMSIQPQFKVTKEYIVFLKDEVMKMFFDENEIRSVCHRSNCHIELTKRILNRKLGDYKIVKYAIIQIKGRDDCSIRQCNRLLEQRCPHYRNRQEYLRKTDCCTIYSEEFSPDNASLYFQYQRSGATTYQFGKVIIKSPFENNCKRTLKRCYWKINDADLKKGITMPTTKETEKYFSNYLKESVIAQQCFQSNVYSNSFPNNMARSNHLNKDICNRFKKSVTRDLRDYLQQKEIYCEDKTRESDLKDPKDTHDSMPDDATNQYYLTCKELAKIKSHSTKTSVPKPLRVPNAELDRTISIESTTTQQKFTVFYEKKVKSDSEGFESKFLNLDLSIKNTYVGGSHMISTSSDNGSEVLPRNQEILGENENIERNHAQSFRYIQNEYRSFGQMNLATRITVDNEMMEFEHTIEKRGPEDNEAKGSAKIAKHENLIAPRSLMRPKVAAGDKGHTYDVKIDVTENPSKEEETTLSPIVKGTMQSNTGLTAKKSQDVYVNVDISTIDMTGTVRIPNSSSRPKTNSKTTSKNDNETFLKKHSKENTSPPKNSSMVENAPGNQETCKRSIIIETMDVERGESVPTVVLSNVAENFPSEPNGEICFVENIIVSPKIDSENRVTIRETTHQEATTNQSLTSNTYIFVEYPNTIRISKDAFDAAFQFPGAQLTMIRKNDNVEVMEEREKPSMENKEVLKEDSEFKRLAASLLEVTEKGLAEDYVEEEAERVSNVIQDQHVPKESSLTKTKNLEKDSHHILAKSEIITRSSQESLTEGVRFMETVTVMDRKESMEFTSIVTMTTTKTKPPLLQSSIEAGKDFETRGPSTTKDIIDSEKEFVAEESDFENKGSEYEKDRMASISEGIKNDSTKNTEVCETFAGASETMAEEPEGNFVNADELQMEEKPPSKSQTTLVRSTSVEKMSFMKGTESVEQVVVSSTFEIINPGAVSRSVMKANEGSVVQNSEHMTLKVDANEGHIFGSSEVIIHESISRSILSETEEAIIKETDNNLEVHTNDIKEHSSITNVEKTVDEHIPEVPDSPKEDIKEVSLVGELGSKSGHIVKKTEILTQQMFHKHSTERSQKSAADGVESFHEMTFIHKIESTEYTHMLTTSEIVKEEPLLNRIMEASKEPSGMIKDENGSTLHEENKSIAEVLVAKEGSQHIVGGHEGKETFVDQEIEKVIENRVESLKMESIKDGEEVPMGGTKQPSGRPVLEEVENMKEEGSLANCPVKEVDQNLVNANYNELKVSCSVNIVESMEDDNLGSNLEVVVRLEYSGVAFSNEISIVSKVENNEFTANINVSESVVPEPNIGSIKQYPKESLKTQDEAVKDSSLMGHAEDTKDGHIFCTPESIKLDPLPEDIVGASKRTSIQNRDNKSENSWTISMKSEHHEEDKSPEPEEVSIITNPSEVRGSEAEGMKSCKESIVDVTSKEVVKEPFEMESTIEVNIKSMVDGVQMSEMTIVHRIGSSEGSQPVSTREAPKESSVQKGIPEEENISLIIEIDKVDENSLGIEISNKESLPREVIETEQNQEVPMEAMIESVREDSSKQENQRKEFVKEECEIKNTMEVHHESTGSTTKNVTRMVGSIEYIRVISISETIEENTEQRSIVEKNKESLVAEIESGIQETSLMETLEVIKDILQEEAASSIVEDENIKAEIDEVNDGVQISTIKAVEDSTEPSHVHQSEGGKVESNLDHIREGECEQIINALNVPGDKEGQIRKTNMIASVVTMNVRITSEIESISSFERSEVRRNDCAERFLEVEDNVEEKKTEMSLIAEEESVLLCIDDVSKDEITEEVLLFKKEVIIKMVEDLEKENILNEVLEIIEKEYFDSKEDAKKALAEKEGDLKSNVSLEIMIQDNGAPGMYSLSMKHSVSIKHSTSNQEDSRHEVMIESSIVHKKEHKTSGLKFILHEDAKKGPSMSSLEKIKETSLVDKVESVEEFCTKTGSDNTKEQSSLHFIEELQKESLVEGEVKDEEHPVDETEGVKEEEENIDQNKTEIESKTIEVSGSHVQNFEVSEIGKELVLLEDSEPDEKDIVKVNHVKECFTVEKVFSMERVYSAEDGVSITEQVKTMERFASEHTLQADDMNIIEKVGAVKHRLSTEVVISTGASVGLSEHQFRREEFIMECSKEDRKEVNVGGVEAVQMRSVTVRNDIFEESKVLITSEIKQKDAVVVREENNCDVEGRPVKAERDIPAGFIEIEDIESKGRLLEGVKEEYLIVEEEHNLTKEVEEVAATIVSNKEDTSEQAEEEPESVTALDKAFFETLRQSQKVEDEGLPLKPYRPPKNDADPEQKTADGNPNFSIEFKIDIKLDFMFKDNKEIYVRKKHVSISEDQVMPPASKTQKRSHASTRDNSKNNISLQEKTVPSFININVTCSPNLQADMDVNMDVNSVNCSLEETLIKPTDVDILSRVSFKEGSTFKRKSLVERHKINDKDPKKANFESNMLSINEVESEEDVIDEETENKVKNIKVEVENKKQGSIRMVNASTSNNILQTPRGEINDISTSSKMNPSESYEHERTPTTVECSQLKLLVSSSSDELRRKLPLEGRTSENLKLSVSRQKQIKERGKKNQQLKTLTTLDNVSNVDLIVQQVSRQLFVNLNCKTDKNDTYPEIKRIESSSESSLTLFSLNFEIPIDANKNPNNSKKKNHLELGDHEENLDSISSNISSFTNLDGETFSVSSYAHISSKNLDSFDLTSVDNVKSFGSINKNPAQSQMAQNELMLSVDSSSLVSLTSRKTFEFGSIHKLEIGLISADCFDIEGQFPEVERPTIPTTSMNKIFRKETITRTGETVVFNPPLKEPLLKRILNVMSSSVECDDKSVQFINNFFLIRMKPMVTLVEECLHPWNSFRMDLPSDEKRENSKQEIIEYNKFKFLNENCNNSSDTFGQISTDLPNYEGLEPFRSTNTSIISRNDNEELPSLNPSNFDASIALVSETFEEVVENKSNHSKSESFLSNVKEHDSSLQRIVSWITRNKQSEI